MCRHPHLDSVQPLCRVTFWDEKQERWRKSRHGGSGAGDAMVGGGSLERPCEGAQLRGCDCDPVAILQGQRKRSPCVGVHCDVLGDVPLVAPQLLRIHEMHQTRSTRRQTDGTEMVACLDTPCNARARGCGCCRPQTSLLTPSDTAQAIEGPDCWPWPGRHPLLLHPAGPGPCRVQGQAGPGPFRRANARYSRVR
jgi:hypothetical protein